MRTRCSLMALAAVALSGCELIWPPDALESTAGETSGGAGPVSTDTFESGCAPWTGGHADATPTTVAHSGNGACAFCATGGTYFTADRGFENPVVRNPAAATRYHAEAWVRTGPTTTSQNLRADIRIYTFDAADVAVDESIQSDVVVTASWTKIATDLEVKDSGSVGIKAYVPIATGSWATGECFLLDDVTVSIVPTGG